MCNTVIFFTNFLEKLPVIIYKKNGVVNITTSFKKITLNKNTLTLGFSDIIDLTRDNNLYNNIDQKRIEIIYALTIFLSKGDSPQKWLFKKLDIIGKFIDKDILKSINKYENGELEKNKLIKILDTSKTDLINAVENSYSILLSEYIKDNKQRKHWIKLEYIVDRLFLNNQFNGISVDKTKIEKLLKNLNRDKYESLLTLEESYKIDISSPYSSDKIIDDLLLNKLKKEEKTQEISELIQCVNIDDPFIDALTKVKECRIDYSNLIKHYTLSEEQKIYPQYNIIGSCSGRIFISSPGTQYLKKSKRDIFSPGNNSKLIYFDFQNYEPGIAAGLSNDTKFIEYYKNGDMYLKIANDIYNNTKYRKHVKMAVLSTLYGISYKSLKNLFCEIKDFNPDFIIDLFQTFEDFTKWKNNIIKGSLIENKTIHKFYTRKFTAEKQWKINTSAVNHIIQSTGSIILKKCIIKLLKIDNLNILIPMHDALLCEIHNDDIDNTIKSTVTTMEYVFKKNVINTTSHVIVGDFAN